MKHLGRPRRPFLPVVLAVLLTPAAQARADGEMRPALPAEQSFYRSVLETFDRVVPRTYQGWEPSVDRTELTTLDAVPLGTEAVPLSVDFEVGWQDAKRRAEYDEKVGAMVDRTASQSDDDPAARYEPELDRISTEMEKAVAAGDMARVEALQKEMESITEKISVADTAVTTVLDAMKALEPRDAEIDVFLSANAMSQELSLDAGREPAVAGARLFRVEDGGDTPTGWTEGSTFAFLGPWSMKKEGEMRWMEASPRPGRPSTAVHTILVRVRAEKARARTFLEGLDWKALRRLLR